MSIDKNKYMLMIKSKNWFQPNHSQIESWLNRNKLEYKSASKERIRINNPDGDTSFSVAIYTDSAYFKDFRPNHQQYNGSFVKFVSNYKNISIMDAIRDICGSSQIVSGYQALKKEEENEDIISLPKGTKPLKDGSGSMYDIVMNYLLNERHLSKQTIYKANIHYLGTRMLFPYYQYGMLVFYQFRDLMNKKFEFPNGAVKNAGDYLYGFDNVEPCGEIIIVESIFNALSVGDSATATGGASLKEGQINCIKAINPHTVILAPDNDEAGIKSIYHDYASIQKIKGGEFIKDLFYSLPPLVFNKKKIKDWNEMIQEGGDPAKWISEHKIPLNARSIFEGIKAY